MNEWSNDTVRSHFVDADMIGDTFQKDNKGPQKQQVIFWNTP